MGRAGIEQFHRLWLASRFQTRNDELGTTTCQCVSGCGIGDLDALRRDIAACVSDINTLQLGVGYRMRLPVARCKIQTVHPKIML